MFMSKVAGWSRECYYIEVVVGDDDGGAVVLFQFKQEELYWNVTRIEKRAGEMENRKCQPQPEYNLQQKRFLVCKRYTMKMFCFFSLFPKQRTKEYNPFLLALHVKAKNGLGSRRKRWTLNF